MKSYFFKKAFFIIFLVVILLFENPRPLQVTQSPIDLKDDIPKVVWTFWFGKHMSRNRRSILETIRRDVNLTHIHITESNIKPFLQWPVHPALDLLSGIHKSDYFRIYFLLHYGGAYTDIKRMVERWSDHFQAFQDPNVWVIGVPEIAGGVAIIPNIALPDDSYKYLVSNGFFISRKNNEFLRKVHAYQNKVLTEKYRALLIHRPPFDRCCQSAENGYPIRWTELLGEPMAIFGLKYRNHLKRILKMPDLKNYQ